MDKFLIEGGIPLHGTLRVSGAKNAALPEMAAALLTAEPVHLKNVPRVRDIITMGKLLAYMEARFESADVPPTDVTLCAESISHAEAPYELVKTMRASVLTLGPLLARTGYARVSLPGGCAIGARPVDLHILGLEQLGARISTDRGYIEARAPAGGLRGGHIRFSKITVTGTENVLMAATLASGETLIENAAREPEVADLAALLVKMGARVEGAGTSSIHVRGVSRLGGAEHAVIPDRIEAGTFLIAAAISGGEVLLQNCQPSHLTALVEKLRETGVDVNPAGPSALRVRASGKLSPADVSTEEHPGFPTDMQAQYMALMTQAAGTCVITEKIFENRFMHASEMNRMGARITIDGNRATVAGPTPLGGATIIASDLRASASLVLAGLVASGETLIDRVYHIDRGYERIEERLASVGARIRRFR